MYAKIQIFLESPQNYNTDGAKIFSVLLFSALIALWTWTVEL